MERELFEPIKQFFATNGYVGDGEVGDIDLYMEKGDETLACELKVSIDFKVVQQAALRQKMVDHVFVGTFKPKDMRSRAFQDKIYLLKRLGIGLVLVSKRSKNVEMVLEPVVTELPVYKTRNKRNKELISKEFAKRRTKKNVGGVNKTKLITSYREDALLVLNALMELGGSGKTSDIRKLSGVERSTNILYKNHYGWFNNIDKGKYEVTQTGMDALLEFEDVIASLCRRS